MNVLQKVQGLGFMQVEIAYLAVGSKKNIVEKAAKKYVI